MHKYVVSEKLLWIDFVSENGFDKLQTPTKIVYTKLLLQ